MWHINQIPQAERNSVTLFATTEGYASLEDPTSTSILCKHLIPHLKEDTDIQTMTRRILQG